MWDNMLSLALLNFGCMLLIGGNLYMLHILSFHPVTSFLGIGIAIVLLTLYIGVVSMIAGNIADFRSPELKRFFQYLKDVWKAALVFSLLLVLQTLIFLVVLPWYLNMGGLLGIFAMGLLFWGSVIWWLASQYYFPVRSRLETNVRKIPLKSVILLFDNTVFTLILAFGTLIMLVLSGLTAFLFPGIGSILLWHQVGLKLRLYKYDYLEEHAGAGRKRIPWNTLLADDRERVGRRTLRGLIFPWKD